jgi:hypothetical protein
MTEIESVLPVWLDRRSNRDRRRARYETRPKFFQKFPNTGNWLTLALDVDL